MSLTKHSKTIRSAQRLAKALWRHFTSSACIQTDQQLMQTPALVTVSLPKSSITAVDNPIGQSMPLESTNAKSSDDAQPPTVSTLIEPEASSADKEKSMNLSLTAIATAISTAVAAAKAVEPAVVTVYNTVAGVVESAENAYSTAENAGATKKAAVLAAAQATAQAVGKDWSAIESDVSSLIDVIKASYNAAKSSIESASAGTASTPAAAS